MTSATRLAASALLANAASDTARPSSAAANLKHRRPFMPGPSALLDGLARGLARPPCDYSRQAETTGSSTRWIAAAQLARLPGLCVKRLSFFNACRLVSIDFGECAPMFR